MRLEGRSLRSLEGRGKDFTSSVALLKSLLTGCSSNEVVLRLHLKRIKMKTTQKGKVLAVNISEDKGTKKTNIQSCALLKDFGLKGDAHAGPWHRQVSLLANESIEKMRAMGLKVGYGDFAENITTEGIDLVHLPIGTEIRVGDSVLLRVTQIGKECHQRCAIYYQAGDCVMPKEGIFAEVLQEGKVRVGDEIIIG